MTVDEYIKKITSNRTYMLAIVAVVIVIAISVPVGNYAYIAGEVRSCEDVGIFSPKFEYCMTLLSTNALAANIAVDLEEEERLMKEEAAEQERAAARAEAEHEARMEQIDAEHEARMEQIEAEKEAARIAAENEAELVQLKLDLEKILPAYAKIKAEWNYVDAQFQIAQSHKDAAQAIIDDLNEQDSKDLSRWDSTIKPFHYSSGVPKSSPFYKLVTPDHVVNPGLKWDHPWRVKYNELVEKHEDAPDRRSSIETLRDLRVHFSTVPSLAEMEGCHTLTMYSTNKESCAKLANHKLIINDEQILLLDQLLDAQLPLEVAEQAHLEAQDVRLEIKPRWDDISSRYDKITDRICELDVAECDIAKISTKEHVGAVGSVSNVDDDASNPVTNIVDASQYTDAKLAELGLELEQIEPEYTRLQTEWTGFDEVFQSTKTEQDNVRKDVARLETGLTETYKSSGISEWEAGLFIGYHCKDYISHDDKKLDAFCKAVEDFRKKSIGGSSNKELNAANYEMRSKVSGLPNASTILNCDQNQGEAIWNCKKKAIEMSSHNADWLKKWNEYSAAAKNLESLEASYQELESQKDEIRPEWNRVSTEYKRISFMICNLDASRC